MSVPQRFQTTNPTPARPWIPFTVIDGRPRNPFAPTNAAPRPGRKRRHTGERKCGDAWVRCTVNGQEYVLLGERADGLGWALPGGGLNPGEHVRDAISRELFEEADLWVEPDRWTLGLPRYMLDPRADDEHWYVAVLGAVHLGDLPALPATRGKSDIRRTAWFRRGTYIELLAELAERFDGVEFHAHRFVLAEQLQDDDVEQLVA